MAPRAVLLLLAVPCCAAFSPSACLSPHAPSCAALPGAPRVQHTALGLGNMDSHAAQLDLLGRRQASVLLLAGIIAPAGAHAQQPPAASSTKPEQKNSPDSKVRMASSGKNVLRDDFCPDPKPGQAILMNCQKAKLKRAKNAKGGKSTDAAERPDAGKK